MTIAHDELERLLGHGVDRVDARPSPYRTSFALDELDITLADGRWLQLIFKDCGPASLSDLARSAKPSFLRQPAREVLTYTELLGDDGRWAPKVFGTAVDAERARYWVLLERVKGVELFQVGDLGTWEAVARWLAQLHRALTPAAEASAAPLLKYDMELYERWCERALRFGQPGPRLRTLLQSSSDDLAKRLSALPCSFIHGECYASNILVAAGPAEERVCGIDWELAGLGPALIDLAALSSGGWDEPDRERIVSAYWAEHVRCGGSDDAERFREALTLTRLHLAVQWLGWSETWVPPPHLSHDWRAEAERLVGQLRW